MTEKLGSLSNARFILSKVKEHTFEVKYSNVSKYYMTLTPNLRVTNYMDCDIEGNVPDGWKYLGEGWSRLAFLGPDGVVYKVTRRLDKNRYGSSMPMSSREAYRYNTIRERVESYGYRLAPCRLLISSVLAMEYVPRPMTLLPYRKVDEVCRNTGIGDLTTTNVWPDPNGVITLIDYAG